MKTGGISEKANIHTEHVQQNKEGGHQCLEKIEHETNTLSYNHSAKLRMAKELVGMGVSIRSLAKILHLDKVDIERMQLEIKKGDV